MPADRVETKESQNTDNGAQVTALSVRSASDAPTPLPGNRPIDPANLKVNETFVSAGIRPVAVSNLQITETVNFSGIRPVVASNLKNAQIVLMSGLRPIASNDIDSGDIMGYLD